MNTLTYFNGGLRFIYRCSNATGMQRARPQWSCNGRVMIRISAIRGSPSQSKKQSPAIAKHIGHLNIAVSAVADTTNPRATFSG